jgi:predicted Zn-dependent protease
VQGHQLLAAALFELKDFQKVVKAMESALKVLPGHPDLQALLAKAEKMGGNNTFEGNTSLIMKNSSKGLTGKGIDRRHFSRVLRSS